MVTGYVFARLGFLSEEVGTALIQFVFKVSVSALLFLAIA
jgi:predicted permease